MTTASTSTVEPIVTTLSQTATLLGVSTDTVRRLVQKGELPHLRVGSGLRIRRSDIDDYVNGRTTRCWRPEGGGE